MPPPATSSPNSAPPLPLPFRLLLLLLLLLTISPTTIKSGQRAQFVRAEIELLLEPTSPSSEFEQDAREKQLLVDTKHWRRNTEFGLRDNWLNGEKPCTVSETIQFREEAVVSMGDTLYGWAANFAESSKIKDMILASNGMLLLQKDTHHLNDADELYEEPYDCVESLSSPNKFNGDDNLKLTFKFAPDSDELSWFNPSNWESQLNDNQINDLIPESHSVPCAEDMVVFGGKDVTITEEGNIENELHSFKVNFRASQFAEGVVDWNKVKINNVRVSRLEIGSQFYNQLQFNRLIQSDSFKDILFDLNNTLNVLKPESDFYPNGQQHMLTIDESSYQIDHSGVPVCNEEAGCLCGNEDDNFMKAICSFNQPLEPSQMPCYDPISSTGYCNKICASVIVITMDPSMFREALIGNFLNKHIGEHQYSIFVGARRTHMNKYEITFRLFPQEDQDRESFIGREREFAKIIYDHLNMAATRSFFGIRSISINSSTQWKVNNRKYVFFASSSILSLIAMSVFAYQEASNGKLGRISGLNRFSLDGVWVLVTNHIAILRGAQTDDITDSFISFDQTDICQGQLEFSVSIEEQETLGAEIPLVNFDDKNILKNAKI